MFQPLYVAATGLNVFEQEMVDVTNNISNAKTPGFKVGRTDKESLYYLDKSSQTFSKLLTDAIEKQFAQEPLTERIEFGSGVRIVSTPKDYSQGTLATTKNPLDIAVQGEGFLTFRMPDSTIAYGRAGNLHMDSNGNLCDPNGHLIEPQITLPEGTTKIVIRTDGTIFVNVNNTSTQTEVGQITLAKFTNPAGLKGLGQNLYAQTVSSGDPQSGIPGEEGYGTVTQYALEDSNVDIISEMMRMVIIQRVFDTVSKSVQSYEAMLTSVEKMKQ